MKGSYTEYVHLGTTEIVREGQRVMPLQLIGYTGLSGIMDIGHLHYNQLVVVAGRAISIPTEFYERA